MLETKKINIEYVDAQDVQQAIRDGILEAIKSDHVKMKLISRLAVDFWFHWKQGSHNPNETEFEKWLESDRGKRSFEEALSIALYTKPQEDDKRPTN
jgi:hypothetical protein